MNFELWAVVATPKALSGIHFYIFISTVKYYQQNPATAVSSGLPYQEGRSSNIHYVIHSVYCITSEIKHQALGNKDHSKHYGC